MKTPFELDWMGGACILHRASPTLEARGMDTGMASKKVTITLEDEQLEAVRRLVTSGAARSVSGFLQHAVAVALSDVAGWGAMLGQALEQTGGPLTRKERAWADGVLRPRSTAKRRRRAA
jgi:hypothetical protein